MRNIIQGVIIAVAVILSIIGYFKPETLQFTGCGVFFIGLFLAAVICSVFSGGGRSEDTVREQVKNVSGPAGKVQRHARTQKLQKKAE